MTTGRIGRILADTREFGAGLAAQSLPQAARYAPLLTEQELFITVQRFIRANGFPELAPRPPRPGLLTPYEPYLRERWNAGCQNAQQLWRERRRLCARAGVPPVGAGTRSPRAG